MKGWSLGRMEAGRSSQCGRCCLTRQQDTQHVFLDSPSDIPHPFFRNEVLWYEKLQAWYHPVAFEDRGHAAAILQDTLTQELNGALDKHPPEVWLQAVHSDVKTYSWTDSLWVLFSSALLWLGHSRQACPDYTPSRKRKAVPSSIFFAA